MKQLRTQKRISALTALLLGLAMLLSIFSNTAFAYERIDTGAGTSLTVSFTENGTGIEGTAFRLYRVADVSDAVTFSLTGAFSGAAVSLEGVENAGTWSDMALTLLAYAEANGIEPVSSAVTAGDGSVTFSGLSVGLYLLAGDAKVVGDYAYAPAPTMILLPTLQEDDTWDYGPTAEVKYTKTFVAETRDLTVKKVWDDENYEKRPDSVTIQLLKDGAVQESVVLNSENGWSYTWKDLTSTYEGENGEKKVYGYTVNETNVPEGYTVKVSQSDAVYTVTNTHRNAAAADKTLPYTGTLEWPIPVLTIAGLLAIGIGWYLLHSKKEN